MKDFVPKGVVGDEPRGWDGQGFCASELETVREWLSGKATTVYAGSYEIQNNIAPNAP